MHNQELSRSRSRGAELSKIEEKGKTTYWSDDKDTQFQSPEWKNWRNSNCQESERKKCQRGKKSGRMSSVESERTVFKRRLLEFFTAGLILVNEHNHPLLLRERRHRLTEETFTNMAVWEQRVLQDRKAKDRVKKSLEERAQNRRVTSGTLPCAWTTSLNPDAGVVTSVISFTWECWAQ